MNTSKRNLIITGILLVVILAGGAIAYGMLAPAQQAAEASSVPAASSTDSSSANNADAPQLSTYDATVYTAQGEPIPLTQIADGKPLVINFWATWCPYCTQEMGDFQQLYHQYGDKINFAFIDCNFGGRGETAEKALAWMQDNGYGDLPVYLDTKGEASMSFGASSLPTTIVTAADGEIVSAAAGAINSGKMDALLASLVD